MQIHPRRPCVLQLARSRSHFTLSPKTTVIACIWAGATTCTKNSGSSPERQTDYHRGPLQLILGPLQFPLIFHDNNNKEESKQRISKHGFQLRQR